MLKLLSRTVAATFALFMVTLPGPTYAAPIFTPGDDIWGVALTGDAIEVGVAGFDGGTNNWPGAEGPEHAIDGVGQKYLNFAEFNTGFLTTPSIGSSVATSITLWVANDEEPRDPAAYGLWGTNAAIAGDGPFPLSDFTMISMSDLALPPSRNGGGDSPLLDENSQTIAFANSGAYTSYLVLFPDVKDAASANSMQIAEVQLSSSNGAAVPEPGTAALLGLGLLGLGAARRRTR